MLEFISVDVYYPTEITEEDWANRFAKNKSNKAPKLAVKQSTKKAKKARVQYTFFFPWDFLMFGLKTPSS